MLGPTETVEHFVAAFVGAWPTGDATNLARFFADDAEYRNGPLEPVCGRQAIVAHLTDMMAMGGTVAVEMVNVVADASVVMTERVDYWNDDLKSASLRVSGVFEITAGRISAWRDYFNLAEFTAQLSED